MLKAAIVDDSKFQLNQLKKLLVELGCEVEAYTRGADLLAEVKSKDFDVVFTDLLMPDVDGFEVLRTLKKELPRLPIIVLTANIQTTVQQKCNELGTSFFLNKPISKDTLSAAIKNIQPLSKSAQNV